MNKLLMLNRKLAITIRMLSQNSGILREIARFQVISKFVIKQTKISAKQKSRIVSMSLGLFLICQKIIQLNPPRPLLYDQGRPKESKNIFLNLNRIFRGGLSSICTQI